MNVKSPLWRAALAAVLLALLVLPSIPVAYAQASWTQDGYVFDSTGRVSAEFIARFNGEVEANGRPVYVAIVDESMLGPDLKPWDVALRDLWDTYILPDNFVLIAVAPFVNASSQVYEYAITELMAGGVYDPISKSSIPGHSDPAGKEIAAWIHAGVRDGKWEDTVVGGVYEIAVASEALGLGSAPSSNTQPPKEETPIVENPVDYSGVFLTLIAVAGGFILLVVVIVVIVGLTKDRRKISDAKHRAAQSHTSAVNLINNFDEQWDDASERLEFLSLKAASAIIAGLRARLTTLKSNAASPLANFESVGERFERPENATEVVYDEIRRQLETQIVTPMRTLLESLKEIVAQIESLETQVETAPLAVDEATEILTRADEAIRGLEADGMKVSNLRREFEEARGLYERAKRALAGLDLPLATELAGKCKDEAKQALDLAKGFKAWTEGLVQDQSAVSDRIQPVDELIEVVEAVMKQLAGAYAESSWKELTPNPARARKNVARARELLAKAEKLLASQDFEQADEEIDNATLALQEAEMLCKSITDRRTDLESAAKKVKELHQSAEQALKAASQFVTSHDVDVPEDAERRLETVRRQFEQATSALGEPLLDYLTISKALTGTIMVAGEILAKSKEAVKAMGLATSAAESQIETAASAIRRTDAYTDDHRRDVDSDARELLAEAEKLHTAAELALREANQCRDGEEARKLELLQKAAKNADTAETKAKEALKMAQADVDREEGKRYRNSGGGSTTVIVSSPTYVTPSYSPRRDTTPPSTYRPSPSPSRSTPSPSRSTYTPSRSTYTPSRSTPSATRSTPSRSTPSRSTPSRGR